MARSLRRTASPHLFSDVPAVTEKAAEAIRLTARGVVLDNLTMDAAAEHATQSTGVAKSYILAKLCQRPEYVAALEDAWEERLARKAAGSPILLGEKRRNFSEPLDNETDALRKGFQERLRAALAGTLIYDDLEPQGRIEWGANGLTHTLIVSRCHTTNRLLATSDLHVAWFRVFAFRGTESMWSYWLTCLPVELHTLLDCLPLLFDALDRSDFDTPLPAPVPLYRVDTPTSEYLVRDWLREPRWTAAVFDRFSTSLTRTLKATKSST